MRDIDPQKIEDQELDWFEYKYLRDRMKLPAGYPAPEMPDEEELEEGPKSRVPSLEEQSELEFGEDELVTDPLPSKGILLEDQSQIVMGSNGGIVEDDEDEEEDYETGWTNDQRRAALSERGLSVDGRKDDLIARLRRSDLDELEDDDMSKLED